MDKMSGKNGFSHGGTNPKRRSGPRNRSISGDSNYGWNSPYKKNFSSFWYTLRDIDGTETEVHLDENGRFIPGRLEVFVDNDAKVSNKTTLVVDKSRRYKPGELVKLQKASCREKRGRFHYEVAEKRHPQKRRHTGIWNVIGYNEYGKCGK